MNWNILQGSFNVVVIGIAQSKLDKSLTDSGVLIDNYNLLRCGRYFLSKILLPKTKPITAEVIYRPPNQTNFFKALNENFATHDTTFKESYVLADFNINFYYNGK